MIRLSENRIGSLSVGGELLVIGDLHSEVGWTFVGDASSRD